MGVRVNLATGGIVGITGMRSVHTTSNITASRNSVIVADTTDNNITVTIPTVTAGEDWEGSVIIVKRLSNANELTISADSGVELDGETWPASVTPAANEIYQYHYINDTIGWTVTNNVIIT